MSFKDISYLELWWPHCWVERNHLCNFGKCIIRNNSVIGQGVQEDMPFKIFLIWSSGSPFVQQSRTICVISVEGIMWNYSVKDICGYFQCAPFPRLQTGKVVWVLSFDP